MATDAQARRDIALLQETVAFQSQMIDWANVQIRDLKLEISAHHAQIEQCKHKIHSAVQDKQECVTPRGTVLPSAATL